MNQKKLLYFALLAGEIMLSNGAETSRVEDTINRLLKVSNYDTTESFVTPTGIFITLDHHDCETLSVIKRVNKRTIHLERISTANQISRDFCAHKLTLDEAIDAMKLVPLIPSYHPVTKIIAISIAASTFTLVFGGTAHDMLVGFLAGFILGVFQYQSGKINTNKFFLDIIGGAFVSIIAIFFSKSIPVGENPNLIIIGSIMPMVPGVAITNAIRDTINGDLIAGGARALEAIFIATSIAIGVYITLTMYNIWGGVL